ncbi:hypothetical protein [Paludisphaera borealis]|nr:hypothetical protein [Paludisphaera borealis]
MSDMQPQGVFKSPADLETFHETTDLDLKGVVVFTIALILMCVAAFVGLKIMMDQFAVEEKAEKARTPSRLIVDAPIAGPRLQADPGRERIEITERDLGRLNSYGWIDAKAGSAHIPIDRAIAILAKSGLPRRGKVDMFHPRPGSSKTAAAEPEAKPADAKAKAEPDAGAKP